MRDHTLPWSRVNKVLYKEKLGPYVSQRCNTAAPSTSTCMWAVLKDRVATQVGEVFQIMAKDMRARSICVSTLNS